MRLGIRPDFSWSFLRIGHAELNRRYPLLSGHRYRHSVLYNGPIFVLPGESLVLHYTLAPATDSPGKLGISVTQLLGARRAWHGDFDERTSGQVDVRLGPGHFYWVTMGYNRYLGRAALDWFVTRRPGQ